MTPAASWTRRGLVRSFKAIQRKRTRSSRQAAYGAGRDIAARQVRAWLTDIEPQAESLYRQAAGRFVALANEFLGSLAESGEASFQYLPRSLEPDAGFRAPPRFYFTDLMQLTAVDPVTWLLDRCRGRFGAINAVSSDATRYAEHLLASNSTRVVFDLRDRLSEAGVRSSPSCVSCSPRSAKRPPVPWRERGISS
jgi:hypothetical protein